MTSQPVQDFAMLNLDNTRYDGQESLVRLISALPNVAETLPNVAIPLPLRRQKLPRRLPFGANPLPFGCQDVARALPFVAKSCQAKQPARQVKQLNQNGNPY
jgi:hypothetical protein